MCSAGKAIHAAMLATLVRIQSVAVTQIGAGNPVEDRLRVGGDVLGGVLGLRIGNLIVPQLIVGVGRVDLGAPTLQVPLVGAAHERVLRRTAFPMTTTSLKAINSAAHIGLR